MIVVTGGSGYVGRYLVEALSTYGDVLILDRSIPDFPLSKNARYIEIDLAEEDPSKFIRDADVVLHLAAESDVRRGGSSFHDTFQTTRSIVDAMSVCGIRRLIFFSSSAVYGNNGWDANENTECSPISNYGRDKLRSESMILNNANIQSAILRFSNICGGKVKHGVVYDFCRKLGYNPSKLEILGDGRQTKEFLHIRDCITAVRHTLETGLNGVYNIGNDDPVSVNEVAEMVVGTLGLHDVRFELQDKEVGWKGDVSRCRLDTSKFKSTGWCPTFGSLEAVRDSVIESIHNSGVMEK